MKRDTCETCRWWGAPWGDAKEAYCHRYPPSVASKVPRFASFPLTAPYDWCGEHKRKDGA